MKNKIRIVSNLLFVVRLLWLLVPFKRWVRNLQPSVQQQFDKSKTTTFCDSEDYKKKIKEKTTRTQENNEWQRAVGWGPNWRVDRRHCTLRKKTPQEAWRWAHCSVQHALFSPSSSPPARSQNMITVVCTRFLSFQTPVRFYERTHENFIWVRNSVCIHSKISPVIPRRTGITVVNTLRDYIFF